MDEGRRPGTRSGLGSDLSSDATDTEVQVGVPWTFVSGPGSRIADLWRLKSSGPRHLQSRREKR
jgi:hypothetical protein